MRISDMIGSLLSGYKKINTNKLPSQSFFYPKDFEIKIKKADIEDIIRYETTFDKNDPLNIIDNVKIIVRNSTILSKKYTFDDIKSADLSFLFFEIVKFSMSKDIKIQYFNDESGKNEYAIFGIDNFNYFDFSKFKKSYDQNTKEFVINGYKFSLPSLGIENSLTRFMENKITNDNINLYNNYSYDFLFFLGNKRKLTFEEIDNLITIFNFDIDDSEAIKIKNIVLKFSSLIEYSVKKDGKIIDFRSKIDLSNIWK
jgi:hypothetical protein